MNAQGYRISQSERFLMNLIRYGKVVEVDADALRLKVRIDKDTVVEDVQFLAQRAGNSKTWWLPSVGEAGLLFSPGGDFANAIFAPAINTTMVSTYDDLSGIEPAMPPEEVDNLSDSEKLVSAVIEYADGDVEVHNGESHSHEFVSGDSKRTLNREKWKAEHETQSVEVNADKVVAKASQTTPPSIAQVEIEPTQITLTVGINKIRINATVVNINGATFTTLGITNLLAGVTPVTFTPVPIT